MTAPDDPGAKPSGAARPDDVEAILVRCLEEPVAGWREAIRRAGEEYPELAAALNARLQAIEMLGWLDDGRDSEPAERRLGPYRLVRELGRGGQATVYLAEDDRLRRKVALKVIHPHLGLDPDMLARLRREAEITSRLSHPGICAVYEMQIDERPAYLAMQFVEGETLARKLSRARDSDQGGWFTVLSPMPIPPSGALGAPDAPSATETSTPGRRETLRTVALVEECARALHVAHEAGAIHRDLSPKNIIVTPEGRPVILDFGLARDAGASSSELTMTGAELGTPAYMSPEQIAGDHRDLDRRSDVFSLGVVLYECLTLKRPFDAPTRDGLYRMIASQDASDPRGLNDAISKDLKVVLDTALMKERDRRYRTALDFAEDLRRVRAFLPIAARPAGPGLRLRRWVQRNPGWATAVIGIFLALSGGLGMSLAALAERNAATAKSEGFVAAGRLQELIRRMDAGLWPARAETAPAMENWIADARDLAAMLPVHEQRLAQLRGRTRIHSGVHWHFRDPGDQARHDQLAAIVLGLRDFTLPDPLRPTIRRVEERLARARSLRRRSLENPEVRAKWELCRAALRTPRDGAPHGPLELAPQLGLVPVGSDPESALQEFAVLDTGTVPERDASTGKLGITGATAVVLVLIPGGRFFMGRQKDDPAAPNFEMRAGRGDWPVTEITLDPFFLAKFEMTAWQWARATESSLSDPRLEDPRYPDREAGLRKPAVLVSWFDADRVLGRLELALPTEAQWEFSCRAGTATTWASGDAVSTLQGHANLAGEECLGANPQMPREEGFRDAYPERAPAGSLQPNRFGLHDLHGNAGEWCAEVWSWDTYTIPARSQDGFRDGGAGPNRVLRGGTFFTPPSLAASAYHGGHPADWRNDDIGVRPARPIDR